MPRRIIAEQRRKSINCFPEKSKTIMCHWKLIETRRIYWPQRREKILFGLFLNGFFSFAENKTFPKLRCKAFVVSVTEWKIICTAKSSIKVLGIDQLCQRWTANLCLIYLLFVKVFAYQSHRNRTGNYLVSSAWNVIQYHKRLWPEISRCSYHSTSDSPFTIAHKRKRETIKRPAFLHYHLLNASTS